VLGLLGQHLDVAGRGGSGTLVADQPGRARPVP
jgi:hypothetical protein